MPFVVKARNKFSSDHENRDKEDDMNEINKGTSNLGTAKAQEHRERILASFKCYQHCQIERINGKEADYNMLPVVYAELIPEFPKKFVIMRECVFQNEMFLSRIATHPSFPGESSSPSEFHTQNVRSVLQQCVRD